MPRIFFSAGEPSGDLHGANLIAALKSRVPAVECLGLGGEKMREAGCELLHPLADTPIMGFRGIVGALPMLVGLLRRVTERFQTNRPDAVVLIDNPGFNWWVARRARALGLPVVYFVPPQLWAWGGWRVRKMQRLADRVLCTLPFEKPWYVSRGVNAEFVGHPYFDELRGQWLDRHFLSQQRARGGAVIGLLPGSRDREVRANLPTLIEAVAVIRRQRPDTRFLVACFRKSQAEYVRRELASQGSALPAIEVHDGRTPEIIHLAHSCIAVSGSVSLELLYHGKPAVVIYRAPLLELTVFHLLKTCKFVSLVNLLADRELFPEYVTRHNEGPAAAAHILNWLADSRAHAQVCGELAQLRRKVAEPGACDRAARHILQLIAERSRRAA